MNSPTSAGSTTGLDLSPLWALLRLGVKALFVAFFAGLWATVVWNAYTDGRVVEATVGASILALPALLVALWVKRRILD